MRLHHLSIAALALLSLTTLTVRPAWSNYLQASEEQEPTVLQRSMETFKHGQRTLHKLIDEPAANKPAILETLTGMESAAVTALGALPPALDGVSEPERSLSHVGYKRTMATLLQALLTMEDAALRDDAETLGAAYEELGKVKQAGHETYRDV